MTGLLDWLKVCDRRVSALVLDGRSNFEGNSDDEGFRARTQAKGAYARGDAGAALAAWRKQPQEPTDLLELLMVAQALVAGGDDSGLRYLDQLRQWSPCEADALTAQFLWKKQRPGEAFAMADKALRGLRTDPWPQASLMKGTLELAQLISKQNRGQPFTAQLCATLREPFAIRILDAERMEARLEMANLQDPLHLTSLSLDALVEFEPHVPWTADFLRLRVDNYARSHDKRALAAMADFEKFEAREAQPFVIWTREQLAAKAAKGQPNQSSSSPGLIPVQAREK